MQSPAAKSIGATVLKGKKLMNLTLRILVLCLPWTTCFAATIMVVEPYQTNASIRGQIYDNRFGLPVADAKVTILLEGRVQERTISDQHGYYEIKDLTGRQYTISVESLGFVRTERTAQVRMGEQLLLDIPLRIGHLHDPLPTEINGVVKLSDKTPANGATVLLISPFDQQIATTTRTDQAGHYAVRVDDPGQYLLCALKSGYKLGAVPVILRPGLSRGHYTIDIELSPFKLE